MPNLPCHSQSKNQKKKKTHPRLTTGKAWTGLRPKDLEGLNNKIRENFNWAHSPREFQLEAIKAQLLHKYVLVHAGTGSGKTTIAAGPHARVDKSKGMVTFMVSPLLAFQEEQVSRYVWLKLIN
jgi:superfamily II RNA helicase